MTWPEYFSILLAALVVLVVVWDLRRCVKARNARLRAMRRRDHVAEMRLQREREGR